MPIYSAGSDWSDPIEVVAGDVIQNKGNNDIHISVADPATPDDAVQIRPTKAIRIEAATEIRVATLGPWISRVAVIRGL